ncbi:MAG: TylF/MycF family methyltransferase [Rhodospirillales bacterium]|nr:TylF/MycF family methyltransferase [Rhodospirillales bacterium]
MKTLIKALMSKLDFHTQRKIFDILSYVPVLRRLQPFARIHWTRTHYTPFGQGERYQIFMSIARFSHINRPISGYYMEFGSHEGNTMRQAWKCFRHLFDWDYVAFDSFEGLPEMDEYDRSAIFVPGNLSTGEKKFRDIVTKSGMPNNRLRTVKGFYEDSLTEDLSDKLSPRKAAVVYIDCDLYKSTVSVLEFVRGFLQLGTVVVFDDWNCYLAQDDHGERRAWLEFLDQYPNYKFTDFVSTAEGKSFICVGM